MHFRRAIAMLACSWLILAGCTVASRPILPIENLLTPAVIPTAIADGESAPLQPPDAQAGAAIYEEKCAVCHGAIGAGDGPRAEQIKAQGKVVANLVNSARVRAVKPTEWHDIVTNGRIQNLMPPFSGSLNAQQRWDVLSYVWALGTTTQTIQWGQRLYQAQCASCHGVNGETQIGNSNTSLNSPRFLAEHSLLDISSGMASGDPHGSINLSEDQRFQIADYVRSLGYRYADPTEARASRLQGDGVIELRAINGTSNGQAIKNLPVRLRAYDSASEVLSRTQTLDDQGFTSFTNLPRRADYFYQAELDYGGGRFYGPPIQIPISGTNVISNVLPVYETTTEANAISIGEMHFFVQDVSEGTATIVEYYLFENAGDRAYIGEEGPGERRYTLKLSAPKDAQNLRFDGLGLGRRFFQEGDVIYDTDVVVPGQGAAQVTMIYEVPYRNGRAFERQVFYPVQRADVIVPEVTGPGTLLTVNGLTSRGLQQTPSGNLFLFVSEKPLAAGESFKFELRGQPLGADVPGADPRAIGFGLIAFGVAVGMAYFLVNRVRALRASYTPLPTHRETLLRQIAALDDDFAQDKLKESAYHERRERLIQALKEVWN